MKFKVGAHDATDKSFLIKGPIELEVDYDDVDQEEQDILSRQVVRILNDHWDDPEYESYRRRLARLQERRSDE